MSPRRVIGAVLCATATLAAVGCGGSGHDAWRGDGPLQWAAHPFVYAPASLPHDRALMGQVRNTTKATLTLDARKVVVRDGTGHVLVSAARFTGEWGHPLYGAFQQPSYVDPTELLRLGIVAGLLPGKTMPLFVSYRMRPGSRPPYTATIARGRPLPLSVSAK